MALRSDAIRSLQRETSLNRVAWSVKHERGAGKSCLDDLIDQTRDPDRPGCTGLVFWHVYSSKRLMPIDHRPQPLVQLLKVLLQVLRVLLLADPI
jgi:hypothetical protein